MNAIDTILLINKVSGVTSFDCLRHIKKSVNKKAGHCGTLDKFATGLIIALCGKYTKYNEAFMGLDKTYVAEIEFGKETDTLDPEGVVIDTKPAPTLAEIEASVDKLIGNILQIPPAYSAIHLNGKRSYELAHSGQSVELDARPVKVYSASILSYQAPFLTIVLNVSKGTYVRSYARDLGRLCNSCAYVKNLQRTKIGPFCLSDAINYDDVPKMLLLGDSNVDNLIAKLDGYKRHLKTDFENLENNQG